MTGSERSDESEMAAFAFTDETWDERAGYSRVTFTLEKVKG